MTADCLNMCGCKTQLCGPLSAETAAAANNFAVQLHCLGQYGAARPMYRRALQIWQKQSDGFEFHTEVVDVLCNLSRVSRACGDLDQAQAHLKVLQRCCMPTVLSQHHTLVIYLFHLKKWN